LTSKEIRTAITRDGTVIRVPLERWVHITESHDYMAGHLDLVIETIENPDWLVKGWVDEVIALKRYHLIECKDTYAVVVFKNALNGFVITAFMTTKYEKIIKRGILWEK